MSSIFQEKILFLLFLLEAEKKTINYTVVDYEDI